jgi:hypothetical protein
VVLEATRGYEAAAAAARATAGLAVAVVNPRQVRDFAKATGRLAKTDRLDATVLAPFAEAVHPEPLLLPDATSQELAALVGVAPLNRDSGTLHGIRFVAVRLAYMMLDITTFHRVSPHSRVFNSGVPVAEGHSSAMRDVSLAIRDVGVRKWIHSGPWQHRETGTIPISPKPERVRKWQGRQYV